MSKKQMTNIGFQFLNQYLRQALDWRLWVKSADDLLAAADEIKPSIEKYWSITKENLAAEKEDVREGRTRRPWKNGGSYLQAIHSMLVAYAIENLIKASLILQNRKQYEQKILQNGEFPKELRPRKHKLLGLVKQMNFNVDNGEINLLLRISRHSYWQGRYPVPNKPEDLNTIKLHKGISHMVAFLAPSDLPRIESLINRIKEHIKDNIKKC